MACATAETAGVETNIAESRPRFGILLFYDYVEVNDVGRLATSLRELCSDLHLRGRLRTSHEGVNGCLSGGWSDCEAFAKTMRDGFFGGLFRSTDFKLSPCAEEHDFRSLKVWQSDEVCGLFAGAEGSVAAVRSLAEVQRGQHLDPCTWHHMIATSKPEDVVLFDVRNRYETRIGRFARRGENGDDELELVDPGTRFFHETPAFLDREASIAQFRGKKVLMYCTGGVRCERASAYLRQRLGDESAEVYQLDGGIQRYLEAFPHGGFFEGSMHVFDRRGCVSGAELSSVVQAMDPESAVLGRCSICSLPWDRYQGKWHCAACRLLVLVCAACQARSASRRAEVLCELCQGEAARARPLPVPGKAPEAGASARPSGWALSLETLEAAAKAWDAAAAEAAVAEHVRWLGCRRLREAAASDLRRLRALRAVFDRASAEGGRAALLCGEAVDRLLRDPALRRVVHRVVVAADMALRLVQAPSHHDGTAEDVLECAVVGLRIFWRLSECADARPSVIATGETWSQVLAESCQMARSKEETPLRIAAISAARAVFEQPSLRSALLPGAMLLDEALALCVMARAADAGEARSARRKRGDASIAALGALSAMQSACCALPALAASRLRIEAAIESSQSAPDH